MCAVNILLKRKREFIPPSFQSIYLILNGLFNSIFRGTCHSKRVSGSELQEFSVGTIEVGFTSGPELGLWELQVSNIMPASLSFGFRGVHLSSRDGREVGKLRFDLWVKSTFLTVRYIKRRLVQSCSSESERIWACSWSLLPGPWLDYVQGLTLLECLPFVRPCLHSAIALLISYGIDLVGA